MAKTPFIRTVNDQAGKLEHVLSELTDSLATDERRGRYILCLGGTATSDLTGISAAGADADARRATPAIDAEALVTGRPVSASAIPVSPQGIVSPVVISRAMTELLACQIEVADCGTFLSPKLDTLRISERPAKCLTTGEALPYETVKLLFEEGKRIGREISSTASHLIIGECVPGGTTTAMGVLTALGYPASRLVSSSMPSSDHERRRLLVDEGISKAGLTVENAKDDPYLAISAVGDPMQPFALGLALEASLTIPVVLGGGTQMLAVYGLAQWLAGDAELSKRSLIVVTTKWVAFDSGSNAGRLAELVQAPFAASCPDFFASRHSGLQAYEEGNVKEGVAAGALMALANLSGHSDTDIVEAIDKQYDRLVLQEVR